MTTHIQGKYDFSIEKSKSFNIWLHSNTALRASDDQKKFWFACCCKFFRNFSTGWIPVEKKLLLDAESTNCYIHDGQIVQCKQVCTRFELQIFLKKIGSRNLQAAFACCFPWASCARLAELEDCGPRTGSLFKFEVHSMAHLFWGYEKPAVKSEAQAFYFLWDVFYSLQR